MSKICTTCGETKPLTEFHKCNQHSDGRRNPCKVCRNASLRKPLKPYLRKCRVCGLEATQEPELVLFKVKTADKYGHASLCKDCWKKQHNKGGEYYAIKMAIKKRYNQTPEESHKNKVRHIARKAYPEIECCEACSSTENLHRHHPDYDKPLEIVVLCESCHMEVHKN